MSILARNPEAAAAVTLPVPAAPIRVLLIEGDRAYARLIVELLQGVSPSGFLVEHSERLSDALDHLNRGGADIVLLDLQLPDGSGLEMFERIRKATTQQPIVIISGLDDERFALAAVRSGAQDYLVKARIDGNLLARVIRFSIERKQAEQAIRLERDRANRYLDAAQVMLVALDPEGRIVLANRHACSIFGCPADELQGRDFEAFLPARTCGAHAPPSDDVAAGDRSTTEHPLLTRMGEERLIEWRSTVMRDETRHVIGTICAGLDITEHKRADEARRSSEGRDRTLFDYAPDGIVIADRQSYYIDANTSMCRMLGYTRDEFIGLHASDIVDPTEVPHIGSALHVINSTSDYQREWKFRRKDGSVFWADVIATVMADGNLLGMIRDVTERNQATEALRTAEERMRFALQNANVGIWDLDYNTGILRWSDIMEAQFGLEPGTFRGTFADFVERIHPDDRAALLEVIGSAMKTGSDFSVPHRATWSDGSVRWLSAAGRILLGEHGQPVRGVGISLDVTERHTLEAQFQQAQKMEALGRLAGGVAHDFNNLLTAILGYCELMLTDLEPADSHHADVTQIQKAGMRAAGLTRQLLAFSRKELIEPRRLDLNAIMADMRPMLGRLIGEDVTVVLRLQPDLSPVKADQGQIEQIVLNLAVNARDAMPNGGVLTIATANVALDEHRATAHFAVKPGPHVELTVSDTGSGMTPAVQARLFEPFFTTKSVDKGSGLGLATVHSIVMRNGGSVGVDSEIGKGTSFKIYFPIADAVEMDVDAPPPVPRPCVGAETVLVVEDAEGLRALTQRLLERQGYTVLVAANADEARELFTTNGSIALMLTDVVMPGASGPELTRQLVEQRPELKVIYMSGYTEDIIANYGVLEPGIAFLHKPFTSAALGRKIRDVLDR